MVTNKSNRNYSIAASAYTDVPVGRYRHVSLFAGPDAPLPWVSTAETTELALFEQARQNALTYECMQLAILDVARFEGRRAPKLPAAWEDRSAFWAGAAHEFARARIESALKEAVE